LTSHRSTSIGTHRFVGRSASRQPGDERRAAEAPLVADAAAREVARGGEGEDLGLGDLEEVSGLGGGEDLGGSATELVVADRERPRGKLPQALEAGGRDRVDVLGDQGRDEVLLRGTECIGGAVEALSLRGGQANVERDLRRQGHISRISHIRAPRQSAELTAGAATVLFVAAIIEELELDLEVFTGPFDLLLTLVLREEVDLLEVALADVVVSYLDVLEARGELDLDVATELLVLIAALLELKSRLMLPRDEEQLLEDFAPGEAAEELLARMLEARRYRQAAEHLTERLAGEHGYRYRSAPRPSFMKRVAVPDPGNAQTVYDSAQLGAAVGGLLRLPEPIALDHLTFVHVTVAERLAHLRELLRRGACTFTEAVVDADRMTVAVTLFSLLELYKQGEATWTQSGTFTEIHITPVPRAETIRTLGGLGA